MTSMDDLARQVTDTLIAFDKRLAQMETGASSAPPQEASELSPAMFASMEEWFEWLFLTYHLQDTLLIELSRNRAIQQEFAALHAAYVSVVTEGKPSFAWVHWHDALARVLSRCSHHITARKNVEAQEEAEGQRETRVR
ncbi:hypothetical protein [Tessaracoccus massiliensis]|uniref:hypothetical protein n=1 Tax=Tessaracoccus massiliensis TaxID=1522311 RepID=UPI000590AC41|nr:hypothetical protein [Tessaracoccus massiliensis]